MRTNKENSQAHRRQSPGDRCNTPRRLRPEQNTNSPHNRDHSTLFVAGGRCAPAHDSTLDRHQQFRTARSRKERAQSVEQDFRTAVDVCLCVRLFDLCRSSLLSDAKACAHHAAVAGTFNPDPATQYQRAAHPARMGDDRRRNLSPQPDGAQGVR